jgi:serine/threonine-protein kinase
VDVDYREVLQPGTILAGRYRVGRSLGAGGMGVILEATHVELGTAVAIKVLHEQLARDPERVERFLREARAAAKLRGEHVCRVHDCGTLPGGEPFMAMELLTGCDLAALVDQLGPLPPQTVIDYTLQACAGIAEAHAVGIVHRDLKPTNIFRAHRPDGAPLIKILDFGLAKPLNGEDLSLTQTSNVMGSPRYMSPEQLKSARVTDPRSDIWALGIVMYELLTEAAPFNGDSITELALKITNDPVPPLPANVPEPLAAIVLRCLEKDPGKRFQSIAELAAALDQADKPAATALPEPASPVSERHPSTEASLQTEEPRPDRHRARRLTWFVLASSAALAAATALYVFTSGRSSATPPAAPVEDRPAAATADPDVATDAPTNTAIDTASDAALDTAISGAVDTAIDAGVHGEPASVDAAVPTAPVRKRKRKRKLSDSRY